METFNLLVIAHITNGPAGSVAPTSQVIPFEYYDEAEDAYVALTAQSPKSGCYLTVFRCYDVEGE